MKRLGIIVALLAGALIQPVLAGDESYFKERAAFYRAEQTKHPEDVVLARRAILTSIAAGEVEIGIVLAKKAVDAKPDHPTARMVLAVVAIKRNDLADARTQIARSGAAPLSSIINASLDAWCVAGQGRFNDALEKLEDARAKYPDGATLFLFSEALTSELAGDAAKAEILYRKSLAENETTVRVMDAYGRLLERQGRQDDAASLYRKYLPDSQYGDVAAAGLKRIAAKEKPERLVNTASDGAAEILYATGVSLLAPNSADGAAMFAQLALYLKPDHEPAKQLLGKRYELWRGWDGCRWKNGEDAMEACTALLHSPDLQPRDAWMVYGERSKVHSEREELEPALADVNIALAAHPKNVTYLNERGSIYLRLGRYELAITDLDAAIALAPDAAEPYNNRGLANLYLGNLEAAIRDYDRALAIDPTDFVALGNRGNAYAATGDATHAMADFDAAIRLKPDFARSYADRAALKETLGDDEGARADREKAKALDPLIDVRPFSGARSPTND